MIQRVKVRPNDDRHYLNPALVQYELLQDVRNPCHNSCGHFLIYIWLS